MATVLNPLSRDELFRYRRAGTATYTDSQGNTVTVGPDVARFNYDEDGNFLGIKFGDRDTATIPSIINRLWRGTPDDIGTLLVMGQAPNELTWFRCGDIEIEGVEATKLHVLELTATEMATLENSMHIFPNEDNVDGECHFLLAKHYIGNEIVQMEEMQETLEFNLFLHQDWNTATTISLEDDSGMLALESGGLFEAEDYDPITT